MPWILWAFALFRELAQENPVILFSNAILEAMESSITAPETNSEDTLNEKELPEDPSGNAPDPKTPLTEAADIPTKLQHAKHVKPKRLKRDASNASQQRMFIGGVCIIAVLATIVVLAATLIPITVTVNGQQVQLISEKTVGAAIEKAGLEVTPGDFLAIDESVIAEGGGAPFDAVIGDEQVSDPQYVLEDGDVIEIADGSDITEDSTLTSEIVPFTANVQGSGAIHTLEGTGKDGEREICVGNVSGIRIPKPIEDPVDILCVYHNANVGDQKVIALTFDDGPNAEYTPQILDILERNGASATFFTLGSRINGACIEIVQRAYNAGHQICTHSWDHAAGSGNGVDLSRMTQEEQVNEIVKGYEAITAVTGQEASRIIRTPGGNFPSALIATLSPYISSEIGWNIDTQDWRRPGVEAIKSEILSARPGDIVLMHDGGGDRSQTIQALAEALPRLRDQGYRFVTIDQLLEISAQNG